MLLHIGGDTSIALKNVVAVLNMENISRDTEDLINSIRNNNGIIEVGPAPHKSCVVTSEDGRVSLYMSGISATTLSARAELGNFKEQLKG